MCAVAAVRNDKKCSHLHDGSEIPLGRVICMAGHRWGTYVASATAPTPPCDILWPGSLATFSRPTQVLVRMYLVEVYAVGDTVGVDAVSEVEAKSGLLLSFKTDLAEYVAMSLDSSSVRRLGVFGYVLPP